MKPCDRVVYVSMIDRSWLSHLDVDDPILSNSDKGQLAYYCEELRDYWDINTLDDYWRTALCWKYPEKFKQVSPAKKKSLHWAELLARVPRLARYCDFSRFSAADWADLLSEQPRFAKHFIATKRGALSNKVVHRKVKRTSCL